jgi:hypothetical protein
MKLLYNEKTQTFSSQPVKGFSMVCCKTNTDEFKVFKAFINRIPKDKSLSIVIKDWGDFKEFLYNLKKYGYEIKIKAVCENNEI